MLATLLGALLAAVRSSRRAGWDWGSSLGGFEGPDPEQRSTMYDREQKNASSLSEAKACEGGLGGQCPTQGGGILLTTQITVITRVPCPMGELTCRRARRCGEETGAAVVEINSSREVIVTYSIAQDAGWCTGGMC